MNEIKNGTVYMCFAFEIIDKYNNKSTHKVTAKNYIDAEADMKDLLSNGEKIAALLYALPETNTIDAPSNTLIMEKLNYIYSVKGLTATPSLIKQTEKEAVYKAKEISEYLGTRVCLMHPGNNTALITFDKGVTIGQLAGINY